MNSEGNESLSKTTKSILNKYGIRLNKNLGQNYLIDKNKRDQIINFGNQIWKTLDLIQLSLYLQIMDEMVILTTNQ